MTKNVPDGDCAVHIILQDPDFLLVYKPALLLSIPGRNKEEGDSLLQRLRLTFPTVHTCHRLDLDTSGIMVVALNRGALAAINRQFEERRVRKVYQALVYGTMEQLRGRIDLPIAPDWERRPRCKVCHQRGKDALTEYEVVERVPGLPATRVNLFPLTGRTHQLRLHLSEIGHPIIGCDLYAHPTALAMAPRLMLHATEIMLYHPRSGLPVTGISAAPF